jgi:glucose/arabinose dehydrogenase
MFATVRTAFVAASAFALTACAAGREVPVAQTVGVQPTIPEPQTSLIPVMRTPKAESWAAGDAPTAPAGFRVMRFAEGLDHPRWLQVLPNGDVLVALSSTKPKEPKTIKDWVMGRVMKRVKAVGPSADQVVLLRDANGDGIAELRQLILQNLNQPFGMALSGEHLYVGNTDALVRFPYRAGGGPISAPPEKVVDLPHAEDGHWTRHVLSARQGGKLFVSVGSLSNISDGGMEVERNRAAIWEVDPQTRAWRVYASGLRNANGMDFEPTTGALYTVVNERDMIGDDASPDYLTSVREGAFYGWPWSYWGQHVDERVKPANPDMVAKAIAPDYALGSHVAALGLAFYKANLFPAAYRGGAFVGEHGSWNRSEYSGYKVVFVPFAGGRPSGPPQDFLTGFFHEENKVSGRPVGVAVARDGALLVADDVGGIVWRVAPV